MKISEEEMDEIIKDISRTKVLSLTFGPDYVMLNRTKKNTWAKDIINKFRRRKSKKNT